MLIMKEFVRQLRCWHNGGVPLLGYGGPVGGTALPNDDDDPGKMMTRMFRRQWRQWQQWWEMTAMTRLAAAMDHGRQQGRTKTAAAAAAIDGNGGEDDNSNDDRQQMQWKWTDVQLLITKKQYRGIGDREQDNRK